MAATRAGYTVTAIDAFADKQTVELAEAAIVVGYGKYGFDADTLMTAIAELNAGRYMGFIYGSGFEAQPDLLQRIAAIIPLIGNTAEVVGGVKATNRFFAALEKCNIPYPKVCGILPDDVDSTVYLSKFAGGCGGTHISIVNADCPTQADQHYYQQWVDGRSVSLLFVSNAHSVEVIGFNEQWLNPTIKLPFRYGGAANNIALPELIKQQMIAAAEKLAVEFGLVGLNSLDALLGDEFVYVLEINPRLSATFDLYDDENLIDLHIQACIDGELLPYQNTRHSNAHAIVYATTDIVIASAFEWPVWVVDIPQPATQQHEIIILAGEPACTVLSQAYDADEAKRLAQVRLEKVQQLLQQND